MVVEHINVTFLPVEVFWLTTVLPFKTLSVVLKNAPEKLLLKYLICIQYRRLISSFNILKLGQWQQPEKHVFKQQREVHSPEPRSNCCGKARGRPRESRRKAPRRAQGAAPHSGKDRGGVDRLQPAAGEHALRPRSCMRGCSQLSGSRGSLSPHPPGYTNRGANATLA